MPRSDWVHCPTRFCHKAASRTAGFTSGETKSLSDCYPLSQSQTNKHQKSLVPTGSNSCKGIQGSGRSHLKLRDDVTGQEPHQGAGPGLRALTSPRAPAPPRPPAPPCALTMAALCSSRAAALITLRRSRLFRRACCCLLKRSYSNWLCSKSNWLRRVRTSSEGGEPDFKAEGWQRRLLHGVPSSPTHGLSA